jgi:hypothetical protein
METRRIERRHTCRPTWDGLLGLSACLVLSHAILYGIAALVCRVTS